MKLRGPKGRIARRLGIAISPKTARILERRPTPPGQHGPSRRPSKTSEYHKQLLEKQRLRAQYGISESQLRALYRKATRLRGNTGERLLQLLERRLDAVALRAGFAPTIFAARQLVAHGHFDVNGRRSTVPSHRIGPNDVVTLRPKSREMPLIVDSRERYKPAGYLQVDAASHSIRFPTDPLRAEVPVICEVSLVVEYYSR